jgi:hypothetical protein
MAEKLVLIGAYPDITVLEKADQMVWHSLSSNLRVEFDPNRCPFSSNVFQGPAGSRLQSGPSRADATPGSYKYRFYMNDQFIGNGEVLVRPK